MARIIVAIMLMAFIAVTAGPAFAQKKQDDSPLAVEAREKKKDAEAIDRQYNATLKRIGKEDAPARVDPWQNMRGTDASKPKQ
jgi:hypothetical protein